MNPHNLNKSALLLLALLWSGCAIGLDDRANVPSPHDVDTAHDSVACTASADCGGGVCHVDRCYDMRSIDVNVGNVDAFEVSADGEWWVRGAGTSTVRQARGGDELDAVESGPAMTAVILRKLDGSLTEVVQYGDVVESDVAPTLTLPFEGSLLDAIIDAEGRLAVAVATLDAVGERNSLLVYFAAAEGWRQEVKLPWHPDQTQQETYFTNVTGSVQLWVDAGPTLQRFERGHGEWRQAMEIDMEHAGFGRAIDRTVQILQEGDTIYVQRSAWAFARKQDLIRIERTMITGVVDLPSTTSAVAPHPDRTVSLVHRDGQLSKLVYSEERASEVRVSPIGGALIVRAHGADLWLFDGATLTVLAAR